MCPPEHSDECMALPKPIALRKGVELPRVNGLVVLGGISGGAESVGVLVVINLLLLLALGCGS